jgi:hypothetical protein
MKSNQAAGRFGTPMLDQPEEESMPKVQTAASLHEKAVQAVAMGSVTPIRRVRSSRKSPAVIEAYEIKVDERVWSAAKELLNGTYTRIEIVDSETVLVK